MTVAPWPFDEWGRITRFLESGRLAFARESELWSSLQFKRRDDVEISVQKLPRGTYTVSLEKHLEAIKDEETFHAAVLIQSYALAEAACIDRLGVDAQTFGGIEKWGTELLIGAGSSWSDVVGECAGAVEVAVVRNAYAHGTRTLSRRAQARLESVGLRGRSGGSEVSLSYDELVLFRARLLSLLNVGGLGRPPDADRLG